MMWLPKLLCLSWRGIHLNWIASYVCVRLYECVEASDTSDSETECSEELDGDTKRRKVRGIGSSIIRGASVLARSIRSIEEKKEKRHRELMELEERRIRAEETRNEVNRQGIAGFVESLHSLVNEVYTLITSFTYQYKNVT